MNSYRSVWKRVIDTVLAASALVLLSPVILILIVTNLTFLGWPVFFVQRRPGLNGKRFNLIKFRTMALIDDRNRDDSMRLGGYGRFIRSTSLDELPELYNVLKGEMSLVGPRPLLEQYLELYSDKQFRRHECRPGITGLAQISGRNALSWDEKFELDVHYVDNMSFLTDIKIILRTLVSIVTREGISAEGNATMPVFRGSRSEPDD